MTGTRFSLFFLKSLDVIYLSSIGLWYYVHVTVTASLVDFQKLALRMVTLAVLGLFFTLG